MARPKSETPVLNATERVKKSIKALIDSGGRRFNLRLSKEGNEALATIMELNCFEDETSAINGILIAKAKQLKKKKTNSD